MFQNVSVGGRISTSEQRGVFRSGSHVCGNGIGVCLTAALAVDLLQPLSMIQSTCGLILAGGCGRRLAAHTGGVPKQFYSIFAGSSLLDDTVSRLNPLAAPERTVVVVDRSHRPHIDALQGAARGATFVYQPCNRGTAVGVLLGVTAIAARHSDAIVVMTPADHGVRNTPVFVQGIRTAVAAVLLDDARVVLFGVAPDGVGGDYGWIVPNDPGTDEPLRRVSAFAEKPPPDAAVRLYARGGVWNTMVLVARAATLVALFRQHQPELTELFSVSAAMPPPMRGRFLANRYPLIPSIDFSRHVLTPAARALTLFTWPSGMGWSDLGTPERLMRWMGRDLVREIAS